MQVRGHDLHAHRETGGGAADRDDRGGQADDADETEPVDGADERPLVAVDLDGKSARVELELTVAYGKVLPDVAQDVQVRVADALTQMCGVEVSAVDVTIEELDG